MTTLLLNISSTTEPIGRRYGSVVELVNSRRVEQGAIPNTSSVPAVETNIT
jgi:hypothetical protein